MKYYSEVLNKTFDSEKECLSAELKAKQEKEAKERAEAEKRNARAADAKVVEEARKNMVQAQENYENVLNQFIQKYGSYHFSVDSDKDLPRLFESIFGTLFNH